MNIYGPVPSQVNKMARKFRIMLLSFLLLFGIGLTAQEKSTHEQIKALKTAFITERMAFTSARAESFWPVYNSFDKRIHALRKNRRSDVYSKIRNDWENLSDEDATRILERYFDLEAEEIALERERMKALRKVITSKEILTLKIAEEDFKTELLKRYRAGKQE